MPFTRRPLDGIPRTPVADRLSADERRVLVRLLADVLLADVLREWDAAAPARAENEHEEEEMAARRRA